MSAVALASRVIAYSIIKIDPLDVGNKNALVVLMSKLPCTPGTSVGSNDIIPFHSRNEDKE